MSCVVLRDVVTTKEVELVVVAESVGARCGDHARVRRVRSCGATPTSSPHAPLLPDWATLDQRYRFQCFYYTISSTYGGFRTLEERDGIHFV
jgi:hypothetical protein